MRDLRVSFPARVERYDAATQLADVKPLIADFFIEEDESVSSVPLPVITNVPVVFPGGGGMRITFPVEPGDVVAILVNDRSLDAWLDQGGAQAPVDQRRHHLSDAVALPGLHDNKHPWAGAEAGVITLGKDSGGADFVALKTKVEAALNAIKTAISAPNVTAPAINSAAAALSFDVGSAAVKVKG